MNYFLHIVVMISMAIPVALGYNLVLGRGKFLHFGPIGTGIVTAYALFLTQRYTGNYALGMLAGFAAAMIVSGFFAWLALRLEGDALGILSIAVHLSFLAVVLNWTDLTRGALGVPQIPRFPGFSSLPAFAALSVCIAALWVWVMTKVDASTLGRSLAALAENRFHAESLGINRASVTRKAFLVAGMGSFLGNILYPQYLGLLHPNDYGFQALVFYVMCVVAGGPGSVRGVALATGLLIVLQESMRFVALPLSVAGPLRLVIFGSILLGAVFVRRKELFPQPRTI